MIQKQIYETISTKFHFIIKQFEQIVKNPGEFPEFSKISGFPREYAKLFFQWCSTQ